MSGMQIILEIGLVLLLGITLVQAIRLERALGVLKRGRAALEPLVEEFDSSTRQAEAAIQRLHDAAEGVGRQIGRQADTALALKDDLAFLVERGDRLADRIDGLVRTARPLASERPRLVAERAWSTFTEADVPAPAEAPVPAEAPPPERGPRVRSQAERDLLKALRVAR